MQEVEAPDSEAEAEEIEAAEAKEAEAAGGGGGGEAKEAPRSSSTCLRSEAAGVSELKCSCASRHFGPRRV